MAANEPYSVEVTAPAIDSLREIGGKVARNLSRAINTTTRAARTLSQQGIQQQVAFPASYLAPRNGRLAITKNASADDLSAVITGRHRPTSLARFATNATRAGKRGVNVTVEPGRSRFLPGAFFVNLRSGNTDGSNNNLGVGIRLPAGQRPSRAYKPKEVGRGLWLLYGPSVDQVFDDVAEQVAPDAGALLEQEFLRLTDLDLG